MRKLVLGNVAASALLGASLVGASAHAGNELQFKNQRLKTDGVVKNSSLFRNSKVTKETRIFVFQFKAPIGLSEQEWLKTNQVEVLRYVPEDAYIVRVNTLTSLRTLQADPRIQVIVPYAAELRINDKALQMSVFNKDKATEIHVRAFKGEDFEVMAAKLEAIPGLKILGQDAGAFVVQAATSASEAIAEIEGVEWVDAYERPEFFKIDRQNLTGESDAVVAADNARRNSDPGDLSGFESGTKIAKFEGAWQRGFKGDGEVITVADTGLDTGDTTTLSRDFRGLKKTYIGGYFSKTWGDPESHGTHVSGSAVSRGESSGGKVLGGANGANFVMEAMWSQALKNLTVPPDPSKLFDIAYNRDNSRIHTNSWGSSRAGEYDDAARSVDEFMWDHQDMVILFAAGNEGVDGNKDGRVDQGSISSPGTAKNVITVGASENFVLSGGVQVELGTVGNEEDGYSWSAEPLASDKLSNNQNGLAAFSSRGPTDDGRLKPDIVAPGTNILSNCSKFTGADTLWGKFNDDLCFCGGTSMATPLTAGAAAVVRQYLIQERKISNPSASLVKAMLMHTAVDMYPGQFGEVGATKGQELLVPGPNSDQGYGRLDVDAATSKVTELYDEEKGLATGEEKRLTVKGPVRKVTLVYTDAPGSTSAQKALVNDLDLLVHVGDKFFEKASRVDNTEQIVLGTSASNVVVVVKGKNVPMGRNGKQPYALVISQ